MVARLIGLYAGLFVLCLVALTVGGAAFGTIEAGSVIAIAVLIAIVGTRRMRQRYLRRHAQPAPAGHNVTGARGE